jgi:hypothetical protein
VIQKERFFVFGFDQNQKRSKAIRKDLNVRGHPGSNRGPLDLQSNAHTTELYPLMLWIVTSRSAMLRLDPVRSQSASRLCLRRFASVPPGRPIRFLLWSHHNKRVGKSHQDKISSRIPEILLHARHQVRSRRATRSNRL